LPATRAAIHVAAGVYQPCRHDSLKILC